MSTAKRRSSGRARAGETFFGGTFEELNRLGWRQVFFPADHAGAIQRRQRLRARRTHRDGDWRLKTMRGETRWVHLANQPMVAADGSVDRFIGVVHDITDRKANEEVLRSQALAIEVMHEGVVLSDSGGIIRMTNPAFDRMFRIVAGVAHRQAPRPAALRSAARPAHRRIRRRGRARAPARRW